MASQTVQIKLTWENGVSFVMKSKLNEEAEVSVVEVAENARIESIWGNLTDLCVQFFRDELNAIGNEMKQ